MPKKPASLSLRSNSIALLLALAPAVLLASVLVLLAWATLQRDLSRADRDLAHALANRIAIEAAPALESRDYASLDRLSADASLVDGVLSITIESPDGSIRSHAANERGNVRWRAALAANSVYTAPILPADKQRTAGSIDAQSVAGRVIVQTSRVDSIARYGLFVALSLLAIVLTLVPAGLLTLRRRRNRQAHLRYVLQALREYELGVYRTRVPEISTGTMGELERSVNRVADAMARSRKDLQIQVNRATLELRQTLEEVEIKNVQLDLARKRAVGANRAKSDFLANMSHEIRTPMNAVVGYTQLLAGTSLDHDQNDYVETIQGAADNLLGIIDDILNLSRLESGKLAIQTREFSILDCVNQLTSLLAPAAFRKGLDFIRIVDLDIPNPLLGDSLRIRQILTNLISNAVKFTSAGHIRLNVSLAAGSGDKSVCLRLAVEDTGPGIDRADRERLFQPFTRGQAIDETETGGTGLGLTICKKLVEAMQGKINLRSVPGRGSTFTVELPLQTAPGTGDTIMTRRLDGQHIVLCAGDAGQRRWLANLLDSEGASVSIASGVERLEAAHRQAGRRKRRIDAALVVIPAIELDELVAHGRLWPGQPDAPPTVALVSVADRSRLVAISERLGAAALAASNSQAAIIDQLATYTGHGSMAPSATRTQCDTQPVPAAGQDPAPDLHVLVVEDHAINRRYLCRMLQQRGISSEACENGALAVPLALTGRFAAVLMDIRMPVMDGAEATRTIREKLGGRSLPIVGLTASALPEERLRYMRSGMDECLVKPVRPEMLVEMLRRMTGIGVSVGSDTVVTPAATDPELLTLLTRELPGRVARMRRAHAARDFDSLRGEVHKINGAAAVMRLHDLWDAAGAMEISLADGQLDGIEMQLARLIEAVDAILDEDTATAGSAGVG